MYTDKTCCQSPSFDEKICVQLTEEHTGLFGRHTTEHSYESKRHWRWFLECRVPGSKTVRFARLWTTFTVELFAASLLLHSLRPCIFSLVTGPSQYLIWTSRQSHCWSLPMQKCAMCQARGHPPDQVNLSLLQNIRTHEERLCLIDFGDDSMLQEEGVNILDLGTLTFAKAIQSGWELRPCVKWDSNFLKTLFWARPLHQLGLQKSVTHS